MRSVCFQFRSDTDQDKNFSKLAFSQKKTEEKILPLENDGEDERHTFRLTLFKEMNYGLLFKNNKKGCF